MTLPTTTGRHTSTPTRSYHARIALALLVCAAVLIPTGLSAVASEDNTAASQTAAPTNTTSDVTAPSSVNSEQASNITPPPRD